MIDRSKFRLELEGLLNRHSMENGSDTPDWILADYLSHCLENFDIATDQRDDWYDRKAKPPTLYG